MKAKLILTLFLSFLFQLIAIQAIWIVGNLLLRPENAVPDMTLREEILYFTQPDRIDQILLLMGAHVSQAKTSSRFFFYVHILFIMCVGGILG